MKWFLLNSDQRFNDRQTIRELENRVEELRLKLSQREQELNNLRREEEQRLQFLRAAIIDYMSSGTAGVS